MLNVVSEPSICDAVATVLHDSIQYAMAVPSSSVPVHFFGMPAHWYNYSSIAVAGGLWVGNPLHYDGKGHALPFLPFLRMLAKEVHPSLSEIKERMEAMKISPFRTDIFGN